MNKDMRKLVKELDAQGFAVVISASNRIVVSTHDGRFVVVISGNAGDWRAIRNGLAALRRAGFRWPPG